MRLHAAVLTATLVLLAMSACDPVGTTYGEPTPSGAATLDPSAGAAPNSTAEATASPTGAPSNQPGATPTTDPTPAAARTTVAPGTPWSVPFLGRTGSGPVTCNGKSNVTISGLQFVGIGNDVSAIRIDNCHHVVITDNDFADDAQAITVANSTDVEISWNRYRNITGPHERNGSNRANFSQWVGSFGGSIHDNKGIGGDTEDIISIYQSGGTDAAHPLVIERNAFEGTTWSSTGGSGMMLGDDGGSHIVARFNTLLTPGATGIGVPSGTDIHVTDNVLYGARRVSANVGIYVWNQSSATCSNIEVTRNKLRWVNESGQQNPAWDAGNCSTVDGWDENDFHATIDPATLHVTL